MLLFPGLFLDRVFMSIEEFRKEVNKEVIFAEPFGPDELMVDILDRKMLEVREL
jgi:predicted HTH domain antitoxin